MNPASTPASVSHDHAAVAGDPSAPGAWHADLDRVMRPAFLLGLVGIVLTAVGLFFNFDAAMKSYLLAFLYVSAVPVGCLMFLMIQHMTGGTWGLVARRVFEAAASLCVLALVFAIPVILIVAMGKNSFYPWLPDAAGHKMLGHAANPQHLYFKDVWLSKGFFIFRTVFYFAVWMLLAGYLYAWSGREDRSGNNPKFAFQARFVSGPGILIGGLAINFAFIDWVMTLDPQWYSTMFGVLYLVGSGLEAMAFTVLAIRLLADRAPLRDVLGPQVLNDLGNLMFAFTLLWAYTNFSQFLFMWSGNIADETPYYYFRNKGSWGAVALVVVIFHFFTPFLLLLWRKIKRDIKLLAMVAILVMCVRAVDLFWIVKPMFFQRVTWMEHEAQVGHTGVSPEAPHHEGAAAANESMGPAKYDMPPLRSVAEGMNWTDLPAIAGLGGIFVAAFAWRLKQRPLVPPNDPRLIDLAHGHH
jgi:hypothetical protein